MLLQGRAAPQADATAGSIQIDTFGAPLVDERYEGHPLQGLPNLEDTVVIYGYDPAVDSLMGELNERGVPLVMIEGNESVVERLSARGHRVVHAASVDAARVVILACEGDNATLLAATGVRSYAPDVPIIACVDLSKNAPRVQRAGADFTFSVSQVAGQLLAYHVLGEMV